MNTATPNVLNLLLGIAPVPNGIALRGGEKQPIDVLFGDIMQSVLGQGSLPVKSAVPGMFPVSGESADGKNLPFSNGEYSEAGRVASGFPVLPDTAGNKRVGDLPIALPVWDFEEAVSATGFSDQPVSSQNGQQSMLSAPGGNLEEVGGSQKAESSVMMQFYPMVGAPMTPAAWLVAGADSNFCLPEGSYTVISQQVEQGNLELELASPESSEKVIRVSISLDQIDKVQANISRSVSGHSRIMLNDGAPQSLDSLFEKLNVKEIVIKPGEVSNTTTGLPGSVSGGVVEMKLFAENAGQEVVLRAALTQSQIKTGLIGEQRMGLESKTLDESLLNSQGEPVTRTAGPVTGEMPRNLSGGKDNLLGGNERFITLFGKKSTSTRGQSEQTGTMPDFVRTTTELTMPRERADAAPIRFTLPADIKQSLQPNGHSIQLRLDPEHLGPARLNLTVRDNHLRAVVVVDSPQARQAVEGSLDRLLESLSRADIKVDYIEVTVDQHNSQERMFDQHHPTWLRAKGAGRFPEFASEQAAAPIVTARIVPQSYLGASGVNVLA